MDPFIGQVMMFGGNFAPRGWALCNGQLLPISSNQALFSILGTQFGGDGKSTFALPDLRGRFAMHPGTGSGLSPRKIGQRGGAETVTLTKNQIPAHNHTVGCAGRGGSSDNPTDRFPAGSDPANSYHNNTNTTMNGSMIGNTGGGAAHDNMSPFLGVNFIIALEGIYPSRN